MPELGKPFKLSQKTDSTLSPNYRLGHQNILGKMGHFSWISGSSKLSGFATFKSNIVVTDNFMIALLKSIDQIFTMPFCRYKNSVL